MPSTIKVSKKTLESFKNSLGVNDPRRDGKICTTWVPYNYFCKTFLPDFEYCNEEQLDWVFTAIVGEMFDDEVEDQLDLEMYNMKWDGGCWSKIVWRCKQYSKEWCEVEFNTSSRFALGLCYLDDWDESESE